MATVEEDVIPLLAGDKLSRAEFLRRWQAHPEIKRAELLKGVVYTPSPVSMHHGDRENDLATWIGTYRIHTPGTASGNNSTCLLLEDSPQPDLNLRILPEFGGMSTVEGKYLAGPVEFVGEVCQSSANYELHLKFDLYQEAGVREYLAIILFDKEIRWHILENGAYRPLEPDADGIWRSRVFPGLWFDGAAFLRGDMVRVLDKLQAGLNSADHANFVHELAARKKP